MTVKDPLTNEIIVGEVEFYLLKYEESHDVNANDDSEFNFKADFIGTDFNYANSKEFR